MPLAFGVLLFRCDTQHYLLEKTRIVAAGPRERSFHVFYQLCAGAERALNPESLDGGGDGDGAALGATRFRGGSVQLKPGEVRQHGGAEGSSLPTVAGPRLLLGFVSASSSSSSSDSPSDSLSSCPDSTLVFRLPFL
jgi:hypothetical protein